MSNSQLTNTEPVEYVLDEYTRGFAQCVDNNRTYAVYAQNPGVSIYQNEYNAGYVLGQIQGNKLIKAARNNVWRNFMLDATAGHRLSCDIPPRGVELAEKALVENYRYLYGWVSARSDDPKAVAIMRMMFRMLGIYDGAVSAARRSEVTIAALDLDAMPAECAVMHTGEDELTFVDIYFINAQFDLFDAISADINASVAELETYRPSHCSGFVHMLEDGNIIWAHTTWACFYSMTCAVTFVVGEDLICQNCYSPGQFGSNTDYGFNGHGIGFNETTETYFYNKPRTQGLWITWRAAAAEHFARNIDEFWDYITLDNTATYLNGYMVVDANRNEFALIDMSYERFAMMRGNGKELKVTDSTGLEPTEMDYDQHMVTPDHILGCNVPVYRRIFYELQTIDGAPMRRYQLFSNIDNVTNLDMARRLITYNSDKEPISIAGRWDYGIGTSEFMRPRAHGALDAKVYDTASLRKLLQSITLKPNINGTAVGFDMKYGSAYLQGKPFIWSKSMFAPFKQPADIDCVPDVLDGRWNAVKLFC
jgi:hypothetical protein